jgi:hypothetical protein
MADTERLRLEKLETLLAVNRELALELNFDKLLELIASAEDPDALGSFPKAMSRKPVWI